VLFKEMRRRTDMYPKSLVVFIVHLLFFSPDPSDGDVAPVGQLESLSEPYFFAVTA